ncbi:MAG: RHS repeat-associated core domain-containing protein [Clostridiales bacterium]|nr:RHS repeat-associated core domain-containing protein [Clostridiales bacterium]
MLTDADGNVTDRVVYSPYGKIDERTGETETRFLYVGQFGVQVDENGLYYMRARYYNVDINRFMQEDPIRDGLNWYVYCINNPVAFVDPFGLEKIVVSGGVYHPKEGKKYQYEFIDTALNQINSWVHDRWSRELKNDEKVTWFIAKAGWTDDDFKNFSKAADRENVEVIGFDDVDELISYINDGSFNNRLDDPITNFVVFSHGLANDNGIVSFGYNYTSSYNQNLNMDTSDISKIRSSAFSDNSLTRFYSCNTGTSMDNSFAQVWANTTGSETIGAVGKTEYTYINKSGFWDFLADQVYKISRSIVTGSEDPWVYPFQSYELPEVDRSAYWVTFKPQ